MEPLDDLRPNESRVLCGIRKGKDSPTLRDCKPAKTILKLANHARALSDAAIIRGSGKFTKLGGWVQDGVKLSKLCRNL